MNRRKRKKARVGEYQELGFRFVGKIEGDPDEFGDRLIEFVESQGLGVGGGLGKNFDLMTQYMPKKKKGRGFSRGSCTEEHREIVKQWLMSQSEVMEFEISKLVDIWNGGINSWDNCVDPKWNVFCGNKGD